MARANITVVGLGDRKKGTSSKNGKPYDFQPVSFLYEDTWTRGQKAVTANVSGSDIDGMGGLNIGCTYDAVFHNYNNTVAVDAILAQLL